MAATSIRLKRLFANADAANGMVPTCPIIALSTNPISITPPEDTTSGREIDILRRLMIGNNIDIVIIPPSTKRVVKLRLPIGALFVLGALLIVAFFYSTYVFARYFEGVSKYSEYKDIQKDINYQKIQFKKLDVTLSEYNQNLQNLKDFDKKIRIITGQQDTLFVENESNSADLQKLHAQNDTSPVSAETPGKLSQDEVIINSRFVTLDLNIQSVEDGFFILEAIIQENKDKLSRTPSIVPLKTGHLTSRYGIRNDPFTGSPRMHNGVDWAYLPYTPVYAPADGTVKDVVKSFSYGNLLIVNHGYGVITRYAHLAKIEVKKDQKVRRGQLIARMGGTGARSTAVHLHYEVLVNDKFTNPENYLIDGPQIRN
ncbi:hypothetical protein CHS0354_018531 [Potamilus streckersoni]|uniref:M23ase beta-sheet core domain-containing protein n=1 Tax=Potamilus streckersoni TaxID=2493646 RepID=A0AAE0TAR1_9BIVA|nr:hypothetical protein CHS0354_018531 [Potamilus streckersoni]